MMRITLAPEPPHFQKKVYEPGHNAMAAQCGLDIPYPDTRKGQGVSRLEDITFQGDIPPNKLNAYWTDILEDLAVAYNHTCAYSCIRINEITGAATVDHVLPKSMHWERAYQWDNYLLVCGRINAKKSDRTDILDPMDIGEDWFQLNLASLEVEPNPDLPPQTQQEIQNTIDGLDLNRSKLREEREIHITALLYKDISYAWLERERPFLAKEIARISPHLK